MFDRPFSGAVVADSNLYCPSCGSDGKTVGLVMELARLLARCLGGG